MGDDVWRPDQYHRFRVYRERPALELLEGIPLEALAATRRAVDLGCGTGELTRRLRGLLAEDARVVGVERSAAMIERAHGLRLDGLRFEQADIQDWLAREDDAAPDLIFSNAALHWIGDHPALFASLFARLAPGGWLVVQMPANDAHPSHTTIVEVAQSAPFVEALGGHVRRSPVLGPGDYSILLDRLGFDSPRVELRVFPQHLDRRDDVIEWVRGTTLTPYAERLSAEDYAALLARYRERLFEQLEDRSPFFYPYSRVFIWAQRAR